MQSFNGISYKSYFSVIALKRIISTSHIRNISVIVIKGINGISHITLLTCMLVIKDFSIFQYHFNLQNL